MEDLSDIKEDTDVCHQLSTKKKNLGVGGGGENALID